MELKSTEYQVIF